MRPWLVIVLLGSGAAASAGLARSEADSLARALAGRVAGEPASCVPSRRSEPLRTVDTRTFVYRRGRTIWVNRPERECVGFRPTASLVVQMHGSRYCRGDRVHALGPGGPIPGPRCELGDWTPYTRPEH